jgi:hypothetical protein
MTIKIIEPIKQPSFRAVGKKLSELQEDVDLVYRRNGVLYRIRAFKGELIDGASIPWLFVFILRLAKHGIMDGPALWHDLIYRYQGKMPEGVYQLWNGIEWVDCRKNISRSLADEILEALCEHWKIGAYKPIIVWLGVRAGGWFAWARDDHKRMKKVIVSNKI